MAGRRLALPGVLQGDSRAVLPPDPSYEIVPLRTSDGTKIVGLFGRAIVRDADLEATRRAPTVIFFYGSSQHLAAPHNKRVFATLRSMGVNVFIPEYPGNGMSEGRPSERGYYSAADAALAYVRSRADIDPDRIVAAGQSLGTGPAVDLASRHRLAGLILVSAYTDTAAAATSAVDWMPAWLARSLTSACRFDNLSKMPSVSCPVLFVYGTRDQVTPPWMVDRLAGATAAPVEKVEVPSEHNSLWKSPYFGLNRAVFDWLHQRRI